jgi:hypothetical protein
MDSGKRQGSTDCGRDRPGGLAAIRSFRWLRRKQEEEDVVREAFEKQPWRDMETGCRPGTRLQRVPALLASLPEALSPAALRALYRNLTLLASSHGQPRPEWATPNGIGSACVTSYPNRGGRITAFVASRYGEHLPSQDAWRRRAANGTVCRMVRRNRGSSMKQ